MIAAISSVGPWIIAMNPRTLCRAHCFITECYSDIQRMYQVWGICDVQKCPLVKNSCKIDISMFGIKYFIQLFHVSCLCMISEQIKTPFIVIAGAMSFSDNLAVFRPAWFGGRGILPARFAVDDNLQTCTTVPHGQPMVIDLGFNANTTLNITVNSAYYIYIYVSLLWEYACWCMCVCESNSLSEISSITDN